MAYTKTNWVNDTTPINATNLNKIEQGIYDNDDKIGDLTLLNTASQDNLVNSVNEVYSDVLSLLTTQSFTSASQSVEANTTRQLTIDITKNGYTPLGIVGVNSSDNGFNLVYDYLNSNTLTARFYNFTSATRTGAFTFIVLYVKNV